jgi:hypothetical protein
MKMQGIPQKQLIGLHLTPRPVHCVKKCFRANVGLEFSCFEIACMMASSHSVAQLTENDPQEKETK